MVWATLQTIQASPTLSLPLSLCRGRLIFLCIFGWFKTATFIFSVDLCCWWLWFPTESCQEVVQLLMAGSDGDSVAGSGRTHWTRVSWRAGCMQAVLTNGEKKRGTDDSATAESCSYSRGVRWTPLDSALDPGTLRGKQNTLYHFNQGIFLARKSRKSDLEHHFM